MKANASAKPAAVEVCVITIPTDIRKGFTGRIPMKETVIEIRKPAGSGPIGGKISAGKHTIRY